MGVSCISDVFRGAIIAGPIAIADGQEFWHQHTSFCYAIAASLLARIGEGLAQEAGLTALDIDGVGARLGDGGLAT